MIRELRARYLDPSSAGWPGQLRAMREQLGARPSLLPHHFVETVLPRIGGACVAIVAGEAEDSETPCGYAFLLPRDPKGGGPMYTLRYEQAAGAPAAGEEEISGAVAEALPSFQRSLFYRPEDAHVFAPTHAEIEGVDCGRAYEGEAEEIRRLQKAIWRSHSDGLYPSDLHCAEGGTGCSLVARVDGALAGFLLGFYSFAPAPAGLPLGGYRQDLQLESQLLAVAPGMRRRRIGRLLKRLQAEQAREMGIDLICWTTDPLLYGNALLNFTRLGAVACEFQRSMYSFRNELNRVAAARLKLTWLVSSRRARMMWEEGKGRSPLEVDGDTQVDVVNRGATAPDFGAAGARIAIEIPADWVELQRRDQTAAQAWRDVTSQLLEHYLGVRPGQYILTGTGSFGSRRYLIGDRVDSGLLDELLEPAE